jgi:hypothetical protein
MKTWMVAALLLLLWGCDDQGLPPDDTLKPAVSVQFLEASCTEAWLRLLTRNDSPPYTLTLLRNDSAVAIFSSPPADTTVIDEGLVPSRTYTYRARLTSPSGLNLTGDPVQARTLDTTSHQFTSETTVFGQGDMSRFSDVAIVNDTLAYAVGEVYLRDSSGVLDPTRYNMARWNGATWRVQRVPYNYQGQNFYHPIQTVIAFGPDDVWFAGNGVVRWNGQQFIPVPIPQEVWGQYRINKIWGASSRDVYIVGDGGSIAHFDGITWRRVESGTTTDMVDVWGVNSRRTGELEVYCAASSIFQSTPIRLLRITGGSRVHTIPWIDRSLGGVWSYSGRFLYTCGDGGFENKNGVWREIPTGIGTSKIRGTALNNVMTVGSFGHILHFNGASWQPVGTDASVGFTSVALRGNLVIAAGYRNAQGYIAVGRRQ